MIAPLAAGYVAALALALLLARAAGIVRNRQTPTDIKELDQ